MWCARAGVVALSGESGVCVWLRRAGWSRACGIARVGSCHPCGLSCGGLRSGSLRGAAFGRVVANDSALVVLMRGRGRVWSWGARGSACLSDVVGCLVVWSARVVCAVGKRRARGRSRLGAWWRWRGRGVAGGWACGRGVA